MLNYNIIGLIIILYITPFRSQLYHGHPVDEDRIQI